MAKVKKITFLKAFTENSLPSICSKIIYGKHFYNNTNSDLDIDLKKQVLIFKDVSDYLDIEFQEQSEHICIKKIKTIKGHLIELHLFSNITEYLETSFNSKSRSNFRRYESRLKTCFNIRYVSYFGNISRQEYDRLFVVLKNILVKRFTEKQEYNYELQHLEGYRDVLFDMITEKRANLFVIYDGDKPISIRINMCKKNIVYYILSGYDIDYSKFHLGFIDMIKNIEWCINNSFEIYDLLKGYDYYKSKWSTKTHDYYNHIIYNSNSIATLLIGQYFTIKDSIKYKIYSTLKAYNLHTKYKIIKRLAFGINNFTNKKKPLTVQIENDKKNTSQTIKIDIEKNNDFEFLRKPVYNLLFLNNESINNVTISKFINSKNTFKVQFKNKSNLLKVKN